MAIPKVLDWLDDLVAKVATNTTNIAKNAQDISDNKALFDTHIADDNRHWTTEDRQNFDRTVHFKGYFISIEKLREAYPTALLGDYAIVGGTDTVWLWDDTTSSWLNSTEQGVVISVNGRTGEVILTKTDVGLSNVDNTADVDKPISTAQQAAFDEKANSKSATVAQLNARTGIRAGLYYLRNEYTIKDCTSSLWAVIVSENQSQNNYYASSQIWIPTATGDAARMFFRHQKTDGWEEFVEVLTSIHLAVIDNDITEMKANIQTNATDIDNLEVNKADRGDITEEQANSNSLKAGIYSLHKTETILGYTDEYWTIIVGGYEGATKGAITQIWIPYQFANASNPKMFFRRAKNSTTWDSFIEVLTTKHISTEELAKMKQYKGFFAQLSDLRTAYPTAENGDYAIVGDAIYIWNSQTNNWSAISGGGSTGSNKWSIKRYDEPSYSVQYVPELKFLVGKKTERQWEVDDTAEYLLDESVNNKKIYLFETYVNMQTAKTMSTTTLFHDDGINVIVNGESIYSTKGTSNNTGVKSLSFNLIEGWNKIQILLAEITGSEVFRLGIKFTDDLDCVAMDCYHNDGALLENYVPLVGDSTIEGNITIEGNMIAQGVVGITSNSYLSYDAEEDSISFNFLGNPDGERGSSSNPISVENITRMQQEISTNAQNISALSDSKMDKPNDTYSSSKTYEEDDLTIYNGDLYKCTTAIATPEDFDNTKWEKIDIFNSSLIVLDENTSN